MTALIAWAGILAYVVGGGWNARKTYVHETDYGEDDMILVFMSFVIWPLWIAFHALRWLAQHTIAAPTPKQREARRKTQEEKERKEYERALEILEGSNSSNSGGVKLSEVVRETYGPRPAGNGYKMYPLPAPPPPPEGWRRRKTPDML